ncbi:MAG: 16S rRNA (guanine(527)-N(7))-methyltransferase RsmG [Actinobacteria bacterium]|nr:MAG: 16S rRNA (guanine(527)-N(7))-methyltransferase RsmG [Actinomycetota bacterium]
MTWFADRELAADEAWLEGCRTNLQPLHRILSEEGIQRGLVGPREADRLWDRHLLNCAAPADPSLGLVPAAAAVADVGAGAGLPGLVWAIVRPDVDMMLVEPLQRRTDFLQWASDTLGLGPRVTVVRGRAQDVEPLAADVVTSRAVAALGQLLVWCWPHVRPGGQVLAIKGEKAARELSDARETIAALDVVHSEVIRIVADGATDPPAATVVRLQREGLA